MTDQPADVVFNLVLAGAFREAADLAADHGLPWLVDWLDEHGYEPIHDPRWADTVAGLDGRANSARREMVLAIPRRPAPARAR